MDITKELVTPEVAEELLALNIKNRAYTKKHVDVIAEAMSTNNWQQAGDPIRISKTNVLLDGQHRLKAIVQSQTTHELVIIRGLDDEVFHVMDTGRMRTAGDVLSISGHTNARLMASIARMIINYERGNYANTLANAGRVAGYTVSNGEIDAFAKKVDMQEDILKAKVWYKKWPIFTASEFGFFYYLLSKVDQAVAIEFFDSLSLGADLSADSPVFLLRKKLESYRLGTKRIIVTPTEKLGLVLKAWNLYRKGKTVSYLSFNTEKDEVPTPI